jgi:RimK family alpha-L-glutamate ligase
MLPAVQRFFVAGGLSPTNVSLLAAVRDLDVDAVLLPVEDVHRRAGPGDVALARLDVLPTLDGVDDGLHRLGQLEHRGVHVLNPPAALLAAHDKLTTATRLRQADLPHPRTALVSGDVPPGVAPPAVVKPRFGSWGRDVFRCDDDGTLRDTLRRLRSRPWFVRRGALVQELVPPRGEDLRVIVAGGEVVGAVRRVAAAGEWRTNVALGARRVPAVPSAEARRLALAAAGAVGGDLVGIDLLPVDHGYVIIEVNGCVDLTEDYSFGPESVFDEIARRLVAAADLALVGDAEAAQTAPR